MRFSILVLAAGILAGCGGGGSSYRGGYNGYTPAPMMFATGPVQQACQAASRSAASRARCGCIQAVANQSLSASDQRRGAGYFKNPAALQEVRQSSSASNERFWLAWKSFGETAAALCSAT